MNDCNSGGVFDQFFLGLEEKAYQERIPLRGTFELTARCNFRCNMCYVRLTDEQIRSQGRELSNEEWLDIARQAKEEGMLYLTLTGGEVFARKDFKELYIELSKMGFVIQIFSNGYLIDEDVIEWLSEYPPYHLRFTLYGMSNDTYESVCGIKNGFDRVMKAIGLVKAAKIPLTLVGTLVKENINDLNKMIEFTNENKIRFNYSAALVEPVRGACADVKSHRLSLSSVLDKDKNVNKMKRLYPFQQKPLEYCGSYRKGFWVTWNGKLQLCTLLENPHFSLNGIKFQEAWTLLNEALDEITMPSKCGNCRYEGFCRRCPGLMSAEKDMTAFCKKAEEMHTLLCSCKK